MILTVFIVWYVISAIATFLVFFSIATSCEKKAYERLDGDIKKFIPKPKITLQDIIINVLVAVIPIINFIFLTILCLNMEQISETVTNEIINKYAQTYVDVCKKTREKIEKELSNENPKR